MLRVRHRANLLKGVKSPIGARFQPDPSIEANCALWLYLCAILRLVLSWEWFFETGSGCGVGQRLTLGGTEYAAIVLQYQVS
jgi:hypothetical protein